MEPKTQLDFLIEEFFNTGKLNLNKKDGGITFDQLESLNEYGGNHRSPFESSYLTLSSQTFAGIPVQQEMSQTPHNRRPFAARGVHATAGL